jgi:hypothetical protein
MGRFLRLTTSFIAAIVILTSAGERPMSDNRSDCLTLGSIIFELGQVKFDAPSITTHRKSSGFDFLNFRPLQDNSNISPNDYFVEGFDKDGVCRIVTHVENAPRLSSFEMSLYETPKLRVITIKSKEQDELYYRPVVFVVNPMNKNAYLLNFARQFGSNENSNYKYDALPLFRLDSLSAVMFLDENFFPTSLIRLNEHQLVLGSKMLYESGSHKIESEEVIVFWRPGKPNPVVDSNSCIDLIKDELEYNYDLKFTAQPKVPHSNFDMPLWVWNGSHKYLR